jgi:hypothetical protein
MVAGRPFIAGVTLKVHFEELVTDAARVNVPPSGARCDVEIVNFATVEGDEPALAIAGSTTMPAIIAIAPRMPVAFVLARTPGRMDRGLLFM